MEKGQVTKFYPHRGFGFIRVLDSDDTVFVHVSQIQGTKQELSVGEIVEFEIEDTVRGLQAKHLIKPQAFIQGKVIFFHKDREFGYIERFDGKDDIYVPYWNILGSGYKSLNKGDRVQFTLGSNEQGLVAENVSIISQSQTPSESKHQSAQVQEQVNGYRLNSLYLFGLAGFKAFKAQAFVPLRPITVLAGLNSHGKSSILDALLLFRQTLLAERRVDSRILLDLSGDFLKVDRFEELVYDKKAEDGFVISFEVPIKVSATSIHQIKQFINPTLPTEESLVFINVDFMFSLARLFSLEQISLKVSLSARSSQDNQPFFEFDITEFRYDDEDSIVRIHVEHPGLMGGDFSKMISFSYFLPIWEETELKEAGSEREKNKFALYTIYRELFQPAMEIIEQELLHHIQYVGPLREEPERKYAKRALHGNDIGVKGENAVLQLQQNWHKKVTFVELPEDESLVISWENLQPVEIELGQAINEALRWLGMQKLAVEERAGVVQANFATLSPQETWVTIADVGFGVSQILPVLTTSLLADMDHILVFEQPEIHLHPRAQARLAELLICFARTNRRVIIETHSEYLINRLRRLVAEDWSNQLTKLVSVVFVQMPKQKEGAYLELLQVDEDGLIENWPPGFLAESVEDAEAIVRASIAKRRQASQKNE